MILLKKIHLNNFLSHQGTFIDFDSNSRLLIDGKSGAGKSSIVEAITWALFNKGRVQSRSLIKRGESEAKVTLTLVDTDTDTNFYISRTINDKGVHKVSLSQSSGDEAVPVPVSGTKNIQDYIETKLIKCSYTLFINSVCYPQENLESFVRQTPSSRKDIILELVRAQVYDEYYEKVKTVTADLKNLLSNTETDLARIVPALDSSRKAVLHLSTLEASETISRKELEEKRVELATVQEKLTQQSTALSRIDELESVLVRMRVELNNHNSRRAEYLKKLSELKILDRSAVAALHDEYLLLAKQINELTEWERRLAEIKAASPTGSIFPGIIDSLKLDIINEKEAAKTIPVEQCHNCHESHYCTIITDERNRIIATKEQQLADYSHKEELYQERFIAWNDNIKKCESEKPEGDKIILLARFDALIKNEADYNRLDSQEELKKQYESELSTVQESIASITSDGIKKSEEIKSLQPTIDMTELGVQKKRLDEEVLVLNDKLHTIAFEKGSTETTASQMPALTQELERLTKDKAASTEKLENLSLLKDAFGQNGIKAIVVDYVIPQLEERINTILEQLSNFRIHLDTQKTSVSGDSTIEGLFIGIVNDQGEEFDYDSYSGGQKTKITFAISEGLAELQKMGFRILDEAVIGLDEETGQQFAETVIALQDRFPQMLCVSHVREIKDLFSNIVTCINKNGDSEII